MPSPSPMKEYENDMIAATTDSHAISLRFGINDTNNCTTPNSTMNMVSP